MPPSLIRPHGGELINRIVSSAEAAALESASANLPRVELDPRELADVELIATGAASPLRGFLGAKDYSSVVEQMRLVDGTVWPLPLTLAVADRQRASLLIGDEIALTDSGGRLRAVLRISDLFQRDPLEEARRVYGTDSPSHPGVAYLLSRPCGLVGGELRAFPLPTDLSFGKYRLTPRALRQRIQERGWRTVAGFQTRNPIHRAHEYITKVALECVDGLVIHPLVGETKDDDVPASVRFRAYELLVEKFYPRDRTLLAAFPAAMRYAGPREAIFHALVRKNYGITHLIVGRDHAGVGSFYGPFEAQQLFERFAPSDLEVVALNFDAAFFCQACGTLASTRTCPHDSSQRLELSGRKVREILRSGGQLPVEFTRPEIAEVLRQHYAAPKPSEHPARQSLSFVSDNENGHSNGHRAPPILDVHAHRRPELALSAVARSETTDPTQSPATQALLAMQTLAGLAKAAAEPHLPRSKNGIAFGEVALVAESLPNGESVAPPRGFILWLTGLSGAGKSTLARAIRERIGAKTKLEVLDGDEVRTQLSKGLGFSKEDRDTNIRRIGFVARLLARNGVDVITAAISPYTDARAEVREEAAREGIPFVEVHVHAELEVLIQRDVKGLYKKALAGELVHFTGVSDPYEAPANPEVRIRSDVEDARVSVDKIVALLEQRGLLRSLS
jgi:sulfate adenylyltransferase